MMLFFYVSLAIILFIIYVKWQQSYWKRRGVFQLETEFFFGSRRKQATCQDSLGQSSLKQYKILKDAKQKHGGSYLFLEPIYIPIDPEIIKHIMQNDFSHFINRGRFHHPDDILSNHLFNMEGSEWKQLRTKLTPTFTSGKMKMMFDTVLEKAIILENVVENHVKRSEPCDLKEILAQYTTDVIGSCAFGIECNSLENPEAEFRMYGKTIVSTTRLKYIALNVLPWNILRAIKMNFYCDELNNFFINIVRNTIKYRESVNISRKDFMQLLLELKNNNNKSGVNLTVNQIISQCFIFFLAGFETSSATTTFALYELAQNQDIQDKLRKEILDVLAKHDGKITYDAVKEMSYLDKVFSETLRKYPPVPAIPRICNKDYKIPGTNVTIEKGTRVELPVWGIQKDSEYYPEPEQFNPENFNEENKAKRPSFTYFPFGEGPRICIGARFGELQSKVALIALLRKYRFKLNGKTRTPLEMQPGCLLLIVNGKLWFDISAI